jgi:RNA ligase
MTLHYPFPHIEHLDQIRDAIIGKPEFIIAERPFGFVANYVVSTDDTFNAVETVNDAILRECRGIKFYPDGKIAARPYHKFFNVNEKDGVRLEDIDLNRNHIILDKLDGSMIHPMRVYGYSWVLMTKMGVTEVSQNANAWIGNKSGYIRCIYELLSEGYTPIFEWCSNKNRIVIDYPTDRLVLTAVRNNVTGEYFTGIEIYFLAHKYKLDYVRYNELHNEEMYDLATIIGHSKSLSDKEGFVVRFDDGHMFKLKAEDYLMKHRARDALVHEKTIIFLIVKDLIDDTIPLLNRQDQIKLDSFRKSVLLSLYDTATQYVEKLNQAYSTHNGNRKEFALDTTISNEIKKIGFKYWSDQVVDFEKVMSYLKDTISKNCGSGSGVDSVRHYWNNHKWKEQEIDN